DEGASHHYQRWNAYWRIHSSRISLNAQRQHGTVRDKWSFIPQHTVPSACLRRGQLGEPGLHLRGRRVHHRAAVGEQQGGHRLVAAVNAHHELRRGRVALDVDLGHLDAYPAELRLETLAEPAPLRGVHRERHRLPPRPSLTLPGLSLSSECNNIQPSRVP